VRRGRARVASKGEFPVGNVSLAGCTDAVGVTRTHIALNVGRGRPDSSVLQQTYPHMLVVAATVHD
jgi:hypothetical protein